MTIRMLFFKKILFKRWSLKRSMLDLKVIKTLSSTLLALWWEVRKKTARPGAYLGAQGKEKKTQTNQKKTQQNKTKPYDVFTRNKPVFKVNVASSEGDFEVVLQRVLSSPFFLPPFFFCCVPVCVEGGKREIYKCNKVRQSELS